MEFNVPFQHKKASGVYAILNTQNMKVYVGSAVNFYKRYHLHVSNLKSGKPCNSKLKRAAQKYGIENFSFTLLQLCDKQEIADCETGWIKKLNSTVAGYNICIEGKSRIGVKTSEETKRKLSIAHKGVPHPWQRGKPLSEETKAKLRLKRKGCPSKFRGVLRPKDVGEKISQALMGRKHSPQRRQRNSECRKGSKMTQETKDKMSAAHKGRRHSAHAYKKMAQAHYLAVSQFTLKGELVKTYLSITEAALLNNTYTSNISKVCKGLRPTACGYIWRYANTPQHTACTSVS